MINLLLLDHFYPVMYRRIQKEGELLTVRSLVMVRNRLPAQVVNKVQLGRKCNFVNVFQPAKLPNDFERSHRFLHGRAGMETSRRITKSWLARVVHGCAIVRVCAAAGKNLLLILSHSALVADISTLSESVL